MVEPDEATRRQCAQRLTEQAPDCVVLEAENGASALALCAVHRVDCVLLELDLPDMSGFQILLQLVPRVRYPSMAVIVLTRLYHSSVKRMALQNGAFDCFRKDHAEIAELLAAIRKAIATVGPHKERRP